MSFYKKNMSGRLTFLRSDFVQFYATGVLLIFRCRHLRRSNILNVFFSVRLEDRLTSVRDRLAARGVPDRDTETRQRHIAIVLRFESSAKNVRSRYAYD